MVKPLQSQVADRGVQVSIRVSAEGQPLAHAVARSGNVGAETNAAGLARLTLAPGPHTVRVVLLGYAPDSASFTLTTGRDTSLSFVLEPIAAELSGIVVTSARGAQRIESEPMRVEVLGGDDVAEKTEMRPSDLTKFLAEMAGIRVQQLSAATGAAAVRLQGLRPRYTLLLADGLPSYGGGGGGLDLLQLPPADLHQIEVVKGPASALYGASALGGMINLISKRPGHEGDLLAQATSEGGFNAFGWSSRKVSDRWGYTAVSGAHSQGARDMDGDGWTDVPGVRRGEVRPRFFYEWPTGHSLMLTAGGTAEKREGGVISGRTAPDGSSYDETVNTLRGDVGLVGHRLVGSRGLLQVRAAANTDAKDRMFGTDPETVRRSTGFTELSVANTVGAHDLLAGGAWEIDAATIREFGALDYTFTTASAFAQDAWRLSPRFALTGSGRLDHHSRYGSVFSPRLSLLYNVAAGWSARVSATQGFYAPTPFVEDVEAVGVRRVRDFDALGIETARYGAFDVNGKTGPLELNGTLFASEVRHQVTAEPDLATGTLRLRNAASDARSRGVELFAVYDLEPLFITGLYTLTSATEPADATSVTTRDATYLPRHSGGVDITWEEEETGTWIALEAFYTGPQPLDQDPFRIESKPYTSVGFLASQRLGRYKLFVNIENLTNARQSPVLLNARRPTGEWTTRVWGPLEGRVISAGIRVSSGDLAAH